MDHSELRADSGRTGRTVRRAVLAAGAIVCAAAGHAGAADHGDAAGVRLDSRLDINDVYVFESPENSANVVFVMTTSPFSGVLSPSTYADKASYRLLVDVDGDAIEDHTFEFTFSKPAVGAAQRVSLRATGDAKFKARGDVEAAIELPGGGRCIAGVFDDPFFFDVIAFRQGLMFNSNGGTNFFRALNTNAIVLELPKTTFADATIGVWATTARGKKQVDRMGRPAINTVLVNGPRKDAFNAGRPRDDAAFRADAQTIIGTNLGNPANAVALSEFLFPDILTIDLAAASAFPNGRALADDVIDAELNLLSNGAVTSDFVGNDSTFRNVFPYLGVRNP